MKHFTLAATLLILLAIAFAFPAQAQLNNKPFSFKNSSGGIGMSLGGRQAILNKQYLGVTPDNLMRGPGGQLLDVSKGRGNEAVVSYQGDGGFIPSFRGTSFRGSNEDMAFGVFNAFFSKSQGRSTYNYADLVTSATIDTWTGRVVSGVPVAYSPGNSVDTWTGLVDSLN